MRNKLQEFKSSNNIQIKYELLVETVLDVGKQTIWESLYQQNTLTQY